MIWTAAKPKTRPAKPSGLVPAATGEQVAYEVRSRTPALWDVGVVGLMKDGWPVVTELNGGRPWRTLDRAVAEAVLSVVHGGWPCLHVAAVLA